MAQLEEMAQAYTQEVKQKGAENVDPERFFPGGEVGDLLEGQGISVSRDKRSQNRTVVYSTVDGSPSYINQHMLATTLRKTFSDGSPCFSLSPTMEFVQGNMKCPLHPESEEREFLDSIGLVARKCRKANLRSQLDVDMHMQHRHQQEYRTIERERDNQRMREEREARQQQLELMRLQQQQMEQPRRGRPPKNREEDPDGGQVS